MSAEHATICVLAKAPVPGAVKTRLAAAIGAEAAAELAKAFLADTLRLAQSLRVARVALVLAGAPAAVGDLPEGVELWPQGEGDLGQRLELCLGRALELSPVALAIGTDAPSLDPDLLRQGLTALESQPAGSVRPRMGASICSGCGAVPGGSWLGSRGAALTRGRAPGSVSQRKGSRPPCSRRGPTSTSSRIWSASRVPWG
jgi:hypothetical protein